MADTLDILTLAEGYLAVNDKKSFDAVDGGGSGSRDDEMSLWITAVSRRVDELVGPVVQRTVTDELHDGDGGSVWLRETPVVSVTTVTEYADTTGTSLTVESNASKPSDSFLLESRGHFVRLLRRGAGADHTFTSGRANVAVTYEAGRYATTAVVDARFKLAAGSALRRIFAREGSAWARGGDPFAEAGAGTVGFFKVIDPVVSELLADELKPPVVA